MYSFIYRLTVTMLLPVCLFLLSSKAQAQADGLYIEDTDAKAGTPEVALASASTAYSTAIAIGASATKYILAEGDANYIISGAITGGTGNLVIAVGTGNTLTLTGANTYGGTTTVRSGTLIISGADGALGGSGDITNNGGLEYNKNDVSTTWSRKITGSGTLKVTAGALKLTGDNTFSGAITVTDTLQVGAGGAIGAIGGGTGAITVTGNLIFDRTGDVTWSKAIGGTGGILTKKGAGTLTLTGANTYTGATKIEAGTLTTGGANGDVGTDSVIVSANATLNFSRTADATWSNVISGAGGLTKEGANTLTLTGDNDYTGTTTVSAGILEIGAGGALGGSGDITNNGGLEYNKNDVSTTWSRKITGSGTLKVTAGALKLTGDNTFSGAITVTDTLQVGAGGTTGALGSGDIDNAGDLIFDRTGDDITWANDISGAGILTKKGADTLALTGANTYSGATKVIDGVLKIGKGAAAGKLGTGAVTLSVANSELLYMHGGRSHTVANAIGGLGKLTQAGTDTLVLSGTNLYTGATKAGKGVLQVSGSLTSAVTVDGGKLMGKGTVASVTLKGTTGSAMFGGTGMGNADTLKITGALAGESGGKLEVYSSGAKVSVVKAGSATGHVTVDLKEAVTVANPPAILTLIDCVLPASSMTHSLGDNMSGHNGATLMWKANTGLQVTLKTNAAGLYQGETSLATSDTPHSANIALTENTVFKEVKGANHITYELSGIISGTGFGIETMVDTLILSGENTYTGTTTVTSGLLQIGKGAATGKLGTGAVTLSSANSELLFMHGGNMHEVTNIIGGAGKLTQAGSDTLVLTGENTYSGATKVSSGVVQIGKDAAAGKLGTGAVNLVVAGSELLYMHGGRTHTAANVISGAGKLTQAGTDTLILTGASGAYSGPTQVKKGVLRVTGSLSGSAVTVAGGALCGTDTVKSVALSNTAGSVLYGGNGSGHADTLHIKEALAVTGSAGALNVYSSGTGANMKISHVKAGTASGNIVVNIDGALSAGRYILISCTNSESNLTPTLGRNSSGFCVLLAWESGVGLKATVEGTTEVSATVAVDTTAAAQNATTKPRVTFTGTGGTAPYVFTYKIGDAGAEEFARGTGTSATAEVQVPTATVGSFVYNLVRVSDRQGCTKSITGKNVTVAINAVTGDIPKSGGTVYVYPVPAQDHIVVRSAERLGRIQIRDLQGQVVLEHESSSSQEVELSVSDLPAGIYVVEVEEGQNLRRIKMSKE